MSCRSSAPVAYVAALTVLAGVGLGAAPVEAVKRRAFVTSVTGSGNLSTWASAGGLSGVAAGDNICRVRAVLGGLPNAGAYRAWLSTPATDAYCHVQGLTGKKSNGCDGAAQPGAGPWYLRNGITAHTAALAELTGADAEIYRSVVMDENGAQVTALAQSWIWTGTLPDGTHAGSSCSSWTQASGASGAVGSAVGTHRNWSLVAYADGCASARRLLCLEPGASEAAPPRWSSPGAIVFVTSAAGTGDLGSWPEAGGQAGLAAGDSICRNLATAAGLPAPYSFVAWLSDSATDAADRVIVDAPFRRLDGLAIATSRAALMDGAISVSLHQDETGAYRRDGENFAWTGTEASGLGAAESCDGWTDGTGTALGRSGSPGFERVADWTASGNRFCNGDQRLYCVSNVVTLFWDGFDSTGDASRWSTSVP